MNISNRLKTVAGMVTEGLILADVGTDHGYVPIYLVSNGIVPKAYAMDINKGPLERAKEHIEENNLEGKIETILSDGMKGLAGKDAQSVVVAGMGGELVCKILDESPVIENIEELILSPHSNVKEVRKKVTAIGFDIVDEVMVEEFGKYYNIVKAIKCAETKNYSEFDYEFGKIMFKTKDKVFLEYLNKTINKINSIIKQLEENDNGVSKRIIELKEMKKQYEKAIEKME